MAYSMDEKQRHADTRKSWLGTTEPDYTINNGQTLKEMQDRTFRRLCPNLADWWEDEKDQITLTVKDRGPHI